MRKEGLVAAVVVLTGCSNAPPSADVMVCEIATESTQIFIESRFEEARTKLLEIEPLIPNIERDSIREAAERSLTSAKFAETASDPETRLELFLGSNPDSLDDECLRLGLP